MVHKECFLSTCATEVVLHSSLAASINIITTQEYHQKERGARTPKNSNIILWRYPWSCVKCFGGHYDYITTGMWLLFIIKYSKEKRVIDIPVIEVAATKTTQVCIYLQSRFALNCGISLASLKN